MNETTCSSEITDLARFIRDRTDMVLLYPNRGNAGDSLIAAGTYRFFEKNDIPFRFIRDGESFSSDEILWYSGGGNFVGYYSGCAKWLEKHTSLNRCIVFPHTIDDMENVKKLPEKTVLICREWESYQRCKEYASCEVFLHPDMAFFLEPEHFGIRPKRGRGDLLAFRKDPEKTVSPPGSLDVSRLYAHDRFSVASVYDCTRHFLSTVNAFETIYTNRLHVAVAGHLLKKKTFLFPNSYYKNRAIYDYSLKNGQRESSVEFVESPEDLPRASRFRNDYYKVRGKIQKILDHIRRILR